MREETYRQCRIIKSEGHATPTHLEFTEHDYTATAIHKRNDHAETGDAIYAPATACGAEKGRSSERASFRQAGGLFSTITESDLSDQWADQSDGCRGKSG